jgi:hypothetical protein
MDDEHGAGFGPHACTVCTSMDDEHGAGFGPHACIVCTSMDDEHGLGSVCEDVSCVQPKWHQYRRY